MGKEYLSTPQFPPIFSILTLLEIVTQCYRIFIDFFPFLIDWISTYDFTALKIFSNENI